MSGAILIVEDRKSLALMLAETLIREGYEVEVANRGDEAIARLAATHSYLAVLTDLKLPGADGLAVLQAAREADASLPVFLITAFATVDTAVKALKQGARDYFAKPLDMDRVIAALAAACQPRRALLACAEAAEPGLPELIGSAPVFTAALTALRRVAPTDAAVLLLGPSGSGKELFARALHHYSRRRGGPFVAFNCAAVPETLVESELFGHERGAFTGATSRHLGRFEQAHQGTLFLDEIGEIPPATQTKLLRAVEEHVITRLGGEAEVRVEARLVAATNRDLVASVEAGVFRRDLFHRLSVFPVTLPALTKRRDDIPALAVHLLARAATRHGLSEPTISPAALAALVLHSWPGNVRELANVLERAAILTQGGRIRIKDLQLTPTLLCESLTEPAACRLALRIAADEAAELARFIGIELALLRKKED